MRKLLILIYFTAFFFNSCKDETTPKGIMNRDDMIGVLTEMHITDSYLNQFPSADTVLMQAHSRYNYIFKKFKTDSAKFSKSLIYYAKEPKELNNMYAEVIDKISTKEEDLQAAASKKLLRIDSIQRKVDKKKADSIMRKRKLDSLKLKGNRNREIDGISKQ